LKYKNVRRKRWGSRREGRVRDIEMIAAG